MIEYIALGAALVSLGLVVTAFILLWRAKKDFDAMLAQHDNNARAALEAQHAAAEGFETQLRGVIQSYQQALSK